MLNNKYVLIKADFIASITAGIFLSIIVWQVTKEKKMIRYYVKDYEEKHVCFL